MHMQEEMQAEYPMEDDFYDEDFKTKEVRKVSIGERTQDLRKLFRFLSGFAAFL